MPDKKHLYLLTEEKCHFYYQYIGQNSILHPNCGVKSSPLPSDPLLPGPSGLWPMIHFSIQMSRKQLQ